MSKKIYISGRMTGLDRSEIRRRFMGAEAELHRNGHRTCNPVRFLFFRWPWLYSLLGYHVCLCIDLWMLSRCDGIYMVGEDWSMSKGARVEYEYAFNFNKLLLRSVKRSKNRRS